jgi:hypothetical protein
MTEFFILKLSMFFTVFKFYDCIFYFKIVNVFTVFKINSSMN